MEISTTYYFPLSAYYSNLGESDGDKKEKGGPQKRSCR